MAENFFKYPRTYHLNWSEGATDDDKILKSIDHFKGKQVVVTEKRDGENSSLYYNGLHARSINPTNHPSRDWLKDFHSKFAHDIPKNMRICGENLFAKHSILYENLDTYFEVFSIWEEIKCLSWNQTKEWIELFGLKSVPVLYEGIFDETKIKSLYNEKSGMEGYVVRLADAFDIKDFKFSVAKMVRKNHINPLDDHWNKGEIIPNKLKK
jgi:hypothetical protein